MARPKTFRQPEPQSAEIIEAGRQYLASVTRNMELIKQSQMELNAQTLLTEERVEEMASYGVPARNICALFSCDFMTINNDPILWAAFNRGRAGIGIKVRASIVDDALTKDNLTAKIHLDKIFSNEQVAQQIELSVKNEALADVPTDNLIDIMYNKDIE